MNQRTLPKPQIVAALNEVYNLDELLKNHYPSYNHGDRSDADLLDICRRYLNKEINLLEHAMPWGGGPILAFTVELHSGSYDICLLSGLNYCYSKFALTKELFHVIISDPEFKTIGFDDTIDRCIAGGPLSGDASAEFVAEIAAMEFLFPYKDRLALFSNDTMSPEKIAIEHRLPRVLVEQFLTHYRMKALAPCYEESAYKMPVAEYLK